jgi:transcriptional regulator with XRE-family HTH domain
MDAMPQSAFSDEYTKMLRLLIAARKSHDITQNELANRLGRPQPWISKIEHGVRRIDVIEFYAIAQAIGVDPVEIFRELAKQMPRSFKV